MADEPKDSYLVPTSLVPKDGKETSSYIVAVVSAIAPLVMLLAVIMGLIFVKEQEVRNALIQILIYAVLPGIATGGVINWKYVSARGDVAVAKAKGLADVITAQMGGTPSSEGASLTVTQENK